MQTVGKKQEGKLMFRAAALEANPVEMVDRANKQ